MSVYFKNPGHADIRALTTFGVNVKDKDSAIGYFGTGFKMGVGIVLRMGGSVVVYLGLDRYEFVAREDKIRGKDFSIVHLRKPDGTEYPLGFTTDVGKNWEPWMAYREFRCNQSDENGGIPTLSPLQPEDGTTLIVVDSREIEHAHENAEKYFLTGAAYRVLDGVDAHLQQPELIGVEGLNKALFYRGIRVSQLRQPGLYVYNIQSGIALTEDRTIAAPHMIDGLLARAIANAADEEFIEKTLTCDETHMEYHLNYAGLYAASPQFLDVAERLFKQKPIWLNRSLRPLLARLRDVDPYEWVDPNVTEAKMLQKAEEVCLKLGYNTSNKEIRVVENLGQDVLGEVKGNTIYLSRRVFKMGTKMVAGTLYEEMVHYVHGYDDMTRPMQNFLIDQIVTLVEEKMGEPL